MNCDRIAPWYELLERLAFGRSLEKCRCRFLPDICGARRILALGDGDGRALVALLKASAGAQVDYIDLSVGMLKIAKKRVAQAGVAGQVTFLHGDALTCP